MMYDDIMKMYNDDDDDIDNDDGDGDDMMFGMTT
jgi:hypothetical protein